MFMTTKLNQNEFLRSAADGVLGVLRRGKVDEGWIDCVVQNLWSNASEPKEPKENYRALARSMKVRELAMAAIAKCFY